MYLKNHLVPTLSAMYVRVMYHQTSLLKAISNLTLSTANVGASTSLANLFQCLITVSIKHFFLISYINLPSFNLYPVFTCIRKPGNPSKGGMLAAARNCASNLAQRQSVHSGVENRRQLWEEGQLAALLYPSNSASREKQLLQTLSSVAGVYGQ